MAKKEATARIKINILLEEAGWRLLDTDKQSANVLLEGKTKMTASLIEDSGVNYEKTENGFMDYLMLDKDGHALVVLEAKREDINPLSAKERTRDYARSVHAPFIILSNGNIHYLWDIEKGNPEIISKFPTQESLSEFKKYEPSPEKLSLEKVEEDYIALSQNPNFRDDPIWQGNDEEAKKSYLFRTGIRILRDYQVAAVRAIQEAALKGDTRYLLEMATGTGKTLVTAAISKLFLKTGNAKRILFLVDRLELEDQAKKAFTEYLSLDYTIAVYKENRDTWKNAAIVISTVQSLTSNDCYKKEFSPTDFELVISDESHRSINGNARAVFEYFIGYKLGLTATPKDYLKGVGVREDSQREYERRQLLDTYKTFGCESGEPTYRFSLSDGVPKYLVNPYVFDVRTDITTELLSEKGYDVHVVDDEGNEAEETFFGRNFERTFFNEETNIQFCKSFLEKAKLDPISGEMGKGIVFCVSQSHAAKITNILNQIADKIWPGKYQSDFAVQITSQVKSAQKMTVDFSNDKLKGRSNFLPSYKTSKTRIAVTVGMMTTGYDCQNILNLALMRPIFSPADFIQIKGRGTRKFTFIHNDPETKEAVKIEKDNFYLFDFFANYEYFEKDFDYDEVLELPREKTSGPGGEPKPGIEKIDLDSIDAVKTVEQTKIGTAGMRVDREAFAKFIKEDVKNNKEIKDLVKEKNYEQAEEVLRTKVFDNPKYYMNLERIKTALKLDRRVRIREILDFAFGGKKRFENKEELLESEFEKFRATEMGQIDPEEYEKAKYFFKTYIADKEIEDIIDSQQFAMLEVNPKLSSEEFAKVPEKWRLKIPRYVKDYVNTNIYR